MNEHGITKENLMGTLPPALRGDPSVAALAEALATVLTNRLLEINQLLIYPSIETLDEPLLDILAYDFKVDWWDADYGLEEKRRLLKTSWQVHKTMGTKAAVEKAAGAVYPETRVQEWFEYGGEPYHFRLNVDLPEDGWTPERHKRLMRQLQYYKNLRSWLDAVAYKVPVISLTNTPGAMHLRTVRLFLRWRSYGRGLIRLDGAQRLDRSWRLEQSFEGFRWHRAVFSVSVSERCRPDSIHLRLGCAAAQTHSRTTLSNAGMRSKANTKETAALCREGFRAGVRQSYRLCGTLTRDTMWHLDGRNGLNGTKRLNAGITKEEI